MPIQTSEDVERYFKLSCEREVRRDVWFLIIKCAVLPEDNKVNSFPSRHFTDLHLDGYVNSVCIKSLDMCIFPAMSV